MFLFSPVFVGISHRDEINCVLIMSTLSQEEVNFYDNCQESDVQECTTSKATQKRKLKFSKVPKQRKNVRRDMDQKCIAEDTTLSNSSSLFAFENSSSTRSNPSSIVIPVNLETSSFDESILLLPAVSEERNRMQMLDKNVDSVLYVSKGEHNADIDDCVPESPKRQPRTNLRSIFSRCFQSTYVPMEPSTSGQIFALDSDTE